MIHADSSLLVDLMRETARRRPGPATQFVAALDPEESLAICVHVLCELQAGAELTRRPTDELKQINQLISGLTILYPDDRFATVYARLFATLERTGRRIAAMDLLIATAAIADDAPIVTRNIKDFSRVPGLRVLTY